MAYPVTLNGRTYTLADFEGQNYVDGLPDAFEDFVTQAGNIYNTTSTSSVAIGSGSKTFTVADSGKPYIVGTPLRIADTAAPSTNWIDGIVTSYSGTTLVVDAVAYAGSGTKTSWNINIGGGPIAYTGTLPIAQGGTGGTTAAAARTNLDTYSKSEADSRFLNVSGEASDVTMTGNVTIGDASSDTLSLNAQIDTNVGIGTAPLTTLDIERGQDTVSNILANGYYAGRFGTTSTGDTGRAVGILLAPPTDSVTRGAAILAEAQNASNATDLIFATSPTGSQPAKRMRLTSAGNLGLGTDDPDRMLTLNGTTPYIRFERTGTPTWEIRNNNHATDYGLSVYSVTDSNQLVSFQRNEAVFNEDGESINFRVESTTSNYALRIDATSSNIHINTSSFFNSATNKNMELGDTDLYMWRTTTGSSGTGPAIMLGDTSTEVQNAGMIGWSEAMNSDITSVSMSIYYDGDDNKLRFTGANSSGSTPQASAIAATDHITLQRDTGATQFFGTPDFNAGASSSTDFRIRSENYSTMLFVDSNVDKIMMGSTAATQGNVLSITPTTSATYSTSAVEGDLFITRYNNAQTNGQMASIGFRVTANNSSQNADASINYVQAASGAHSGRFQYNLRASSGTRYNYQTLDSEYGFVHNEEDMSWNDFRVESNNNSNMLFVDASLNRVGIGTSPACPFNVETGTQSSVSIFTNTRNVSGDQTLTLGLGSNAQNTSSYYLICQEPAVSNRLFIYGNGNVVNTNNSYGAMSDARLKENIVDSTSQWDDIKAIQVRKYSWVADSSDTPTHMGVIAQELEASGMGGLVDNGTEPDPVTGDPRDIKTVKYSVLYMKAVKALQESMDRIETLEAKVSALENA